MYKERATASKEDQNRNKGKGMTVVGELDKHFQYLLIKPLCIFFAN